MFVTVMSRKDQRHSNELQANLLALSEACPFDQSNPADCPLFPLRRMKRQERLLWCQALDEEALAYVIAYHHVCLSVKVQSAFATTGGGR
jgi:hypothetical protein